MSAARQKKSRPWLFVLLALVVGAAVAVAVAVRGRTSSHPGAANASASAASSSSSSTAGDPTNPFASKAMRYYLYHRAGNITAAAYDADSRTLYLYHPGVAEATASIMKVDILATLLHQTQDAGNGLNSAQNALAQEMIEDSDNDDAQDLWDEEGGSTAVSDFDADVGMDATSPNTAGYWGLSTTTARDQVDLLRHVLLPNHLLDGASRAYESNLMHNITPSQAWGVSAGIGAGAHVALKNGWLPLAGSDWQVNSIGAVVGSGRHYLLAVLTTGDPTEGYGIRTISHISSVAWHSLA